MKNTLSLSLVVAAMMLSGCTLMSGKPETTTSAAEVVNRNIDNAIRSVEQTQRELYQYGAVNEHATGVTGSIYTDSQRIDLNWNGDANELLAQLARQRSFAFRSLGTRLQLPVTLKVTSVQYSDVMDIVQTQIGYRASIIVDNSRREVVLKYSAPGSQLETAAKVLRPGALQPRSVVHRTLIRSPKAPAMKTSSSAGTVSGTRSQPQICTTTCNAGVKPAAFQSGEMLSATNQVQAYRIGEKCDVKGVLGKDSSGKALSCSGRVWKRL